MTIIFLAECENKQQAELFSRHFDAVSWTLKDGNRLNRKQEMT